VKRGGAALPYPWGGVLVFLLSVQIGKMVERGKWTALHKDVWNRVSKTRLDLSRQLNPHLEGELEPPPRIGAHEPAKLRV
jgi:hypothetical protein